MKKLGSLLAIAALVASLVVSVVAPSPAGAGECDSPAVRDITINQGVGSYDRLAQGKEALVRVFLSLPSCAARGASITLDPASTTMTVTDGTSPLSPALTPVSPVGSAPALVAYSSGPAVDAAADPKFVVPGAALSRADGAGLAAAFSFVIGYQYKASKSSTPVPGSITVTTLPGTTTPISKPVEKRVAPLRVLVVAMGDAARDYSTQLTPDGITAVQRGMHALGRMLPVADGVGSLADSGSPGIRYTITPTIIDLRPLGLLDAEGKFCGRQENFDPIKQSLATYLSEWNAASGNPRADRVLGVVDAAISYGGESMCADGWATIKGSVGWARAIPDTSTTPSMTGALMAMELGHTFGLVPPTRDRIGDLYHSPNEQADGTAPERAYNLTSRSYLAADKTALRMAANGWDGTTTVFEPADWAFAQCALGGTTSTECTQFASTDATAGAATGQRVFVLAGSIGHTATGHVANVVDSHEATAWPTGTTTDNHIVLVQLSGTKKVERTDNVHVAPEESAHHDHEAGDVVEDPTGTFRVAVPFDPDTTRIELRSGSQVLYTRTASPAPVMTAGASSTRVVGNQNISNDPAVDDTAAALSPDAELVAWQRPDGIVIASGDDPTQRVTITGASQPAISPRHDPSTRRYSVAYVVADGSIDMVEVDLASGTPVVGASRDVYLARPLLSPGIPASHPSFSPDNSRIAFEIQKDIATIELVRSPLPCAVLGALLCRPTKVAATAADETWPSWSQSDASTIAYVQGADVVVRSIGSGNDPADAAQAVVLATNATEPSFGTGVVAYRSTDATKPGLVLRDATAPGAAPVPITTDASDARPAVAGGIGGTVAYDQPPAAGAKRDVVSGRQRAVTTWTATDENPSQLVLTTALGCGTDKRITGVGIRPFSVSGNTATFVHEWDPVFGCVNGTLLGAASDGFRQSPYRSAGTIGGGTGPSPAIVVPANGTVARLGDVVATQGSAVDAEDRALPPSQLDWRLDGPDGTTTWEGAQRDLTGLVPGTYTLTLVATDSAGRMATATSSFVVINEWVDVVRVPTVFDPDVMNVPSTGNSVTMFLTLPDPSAVDPASVRLITVDGLDVSADDRFKQKAWDVTGNQATVKFDRQALEQFIYDEHGVFGRSVEIMVGGRTGATVDPPWRFFGADSTFVTR